MKPPIIKIGDKFKIINPEFVTRVGYPLCIEDVKTTFITNADKVLINELITRNSGVNPADINVIDTKSKSYQRILHEVCYARLRRLGFGGRTRSLHTRVIPEYQHKICWVHDKRVVQTGTYVQASSWEDDYEPAYLEQRKTHVLLKFYIVGELTHTLFEIAQKNIEPL